MNKKLLLTASSAILSILTYSISVSPAATQGAPPKSEQANSNTCSLVKNAPARDYCFAARAQYDKREFRAALVTSRKALAADPQNGIIRVMIARIMMVFGEEGAAEKELRQALMDGAPDRIVLPSLFTLMVSRNRASQLLAEFAEPPPGANGEHAAVILNGRALALQTLGQLPEAAAAMDRALGLRRDASGLVGRANIATQQNDKMLAAKLIDEAYQLEPKNLSVAFAKLKQIESSNDTGKTLAFSEQMLNLFPTRVDVRVVRIETFLKLKQDNRAKVEVDALEIKAPQTYFVKYYRALLLARANNKKAAWAIMQVIPSQWVRKNPSVALPIAQIAIDNGQMETGSGVLVNALSGAPDLLDVRLELAKLRLTQGMPQAALLILTPVQNSRDPQVKKLLAAARGQISKDRAF